MSDRTCRLQKRIFNSSTVNRWLKQQPVFERERRNTGRRFVKLRIHRVSVARIVTKPPALRLEIRCNSSEITPRLLFIIYYYHTHCCTRALGSLKGLLFPGALLVRHSLSSRRERNTMDAQKVSVTLDEKLSSR